MASPAKRRKKHRDNASFLTTQPIDSYFTKEGKEKHSQSPLQAIPTQTEPSKDIRRLEDNTQLQEQSDKELAARLQAKWDQEDVALVPALAYKDVAPSDLFFDNVQESPNLQSQEQTQEPEPVLNPVVGKINTWKLNTLSPQPNESSEDSLTSSIPFDENPLTFKPSKYIPELRKYWEANGGQASYALLTHCFVIINGTQSRIKIVDTLVNFVRTITEGDPASLLPAVWLATNSISPAYISLELGIGGSAISKALKKVCGLDSQALKSIYKKYGDAGDVAFEAKKKQSYMLRKPKSLSIKAVYESLIKIASSKGAGSQEFKQRIIEKLVQDARGAEESRYIVRTLIQHLRIGAVKTTMLIALSRGFQLSRPVGSSFPIRSQHELSLLKKEALAEIYSKGEGIVKACFARRPNYNDLVNCLLEVGVSSELLLRCGLALHIPLMPMLGSITRDLNEVLTKLHDRTFSCEYKYDGQRAQVHCGTDGKVSIFSRHLELMTDKYPDLVALVPRIRSESVTSFIMEGEVVAVDSRSGALQTFQTLAGRGRKDVAIGEVRIGVCLFAFDLMYLNGTELLDRPFRERRELLHSLFVEVPDRFQWVKSMDATSGDSESILEFFQGAIAAKCEGIMVKILDNPSDPALDDPTPAVEHVMDVCSSTFSRVDSARSIIKSQPINPSTKAKSTKTTAPKRKPLLATYTPDKRLEAWMKVKKDYASTSDTLDLVPIAGWHGQGRKSAWWSPILLAARNPDTGSLEAVCKCISGFTDVFYTTLRTYYSPDSEHVLGRQPSFVEYSAGRPDVWFAPQEVWEIAFADVTLSPVYNAARGLVSEERGLSLRFPRFLRKRDDKGVEEASTISDLAGLWHKQENRVSEEIGDLNLDGL
ncbi:MAG: hypothetical protein M1829_001655 [Trizodia sp. TS-e1964]|nr:MAG: hypothetical protein M1829_001655 [Trizodia sp. TS-e1964]